MAKNLTEKRFKNMETTDYQDKNEAEVATTFTKKDLISELGRSDRCVRGWIKVARNAYHWMPEKELVIKDGKRHVYTAFILEQLKAIKSHLEAGGTIETWENSVVQPVKKEVEEEVKTVPSSAIEILGQQLEIGLDIPTIHTTEGLVDLNALETFGTEALTHNQEELVAEQERLARTKNKVADGLLSLAKQIFTNQVAEETERQTDLEKASAEGFNQELLRIQAYEGGKMEARKAYQKVKASVGKSSSAQS